MAEVCVTEKKNIGVYKCVDLPDMPKCILETPLNWSIPAETIENGEEEILDYIQDAMVAPLESRVYLWPLFVGYEDQSEDTVYEETVLADLFVRNGKERFIGIIKQSLCQHKAMFTHRSNTGRVFIWDVNNFLQGTKLSNGNFAGQTYSLLNLEKLKRGDGSVSSKSRVRVVLANSNELDKDGMMIDGDFVAELLRLTDVNIAILTNAAGTITFTITTECDGETVAGFLVGDFEFKKASDGSAVVISTLVYANGVYTITQVGNLFVDGTLNLKAAASLGIKAYESTGAGIVDI